MSTDNPQSHHPRREKANLHLGQIVLDTQAIKDAQDVAIQQGGAWIREMEATMEVSQSMEDAVEKMKPVKPTRGAIQKKLTNIPIAPHDNDQDDMEVDTHHALSMPWVVTDLSDSNVRDKPCPRVVPSSCAVKRQYAVANLADYIGVGESTRAQVREGNAHCQHAPNRRALLLGRINKWANDVGPSSGNNSPQNSVPSDSHSNSTPHPPSSTVPSLTTNATSVSSAASDTIPVYGRTPSINPSGLLTHDKSGDNDKDQQGTVPVRFAGYCETKLVTRTANARFNLELEESDDDFDRPISNMALAGSKRKHTDHSSEYIVTSEVDEADDDGHCDRNIHLCTPKAPELRCVTAMSNIVIDQLAKKAKTSNNFSEQGANTVGPSSSVGPGTLSHTKGVVDMVTADSA
ncbi:hypothetical protein BKA82DRAFT_24595 [Pisolithus tinctorius]|uniref:Uncharacterized protein n=1 Tax=Pisolithus tinctorius Marx 270 TaxID=870435 RepID=A0A0C3K9N6_PISTI|nr:hypothetical protein BKA82DRAFT_24595 [Pisolithus tinctorius]KIO06312.1 hypothetical protein M404DRAFT_24595 [Pisolithus tinctorius Marx 270]